MSMCEGFAYISRNPSMRGLRGGCSTLRAIESICRNVPTRLELQFTGGRSAVKLLSAVLYKGSNPKKKLLPFGHCPKVALTPLPPPLFWTPLG